MSNIVTAIDENSEKLMLVVYLLLIGVFAFFLTPVLGGGWKNAGYARLLFRLRFLVGVGLEAIATTLLGVFFAFLGLMTLDTKKRLQGVLLLVGSVIGLVVLSSMGLLLSRIDLVASLPWLVLGLGLGVLVGGGSTLRDVTSGQVTEFRRASRYLFYFLAAIAVIGFLEYHFDYQMPIWINRDGSLLLTPKPMGLAVAGGIQQLVMNGVLVTGFVWTTRRFVQYDAEQRFFVLGPKASGKSLLLVGAYLEALNRYTESDDQTPLTPSQDLMSLVGELDRDTQGWFVEATRTQELEDLRFQYVHGSVFPKNIELSSIDYAGELLEDIPDALMGTGDDDLPATLDQVRRSVERADTLILLIDSSRFQDGERLDIEPYFNILQATDTDDVILVATKADLFAEQFRDERGLDPQQYFDDFREYIRERFSTNQTIQALMAEIGDADLIPIYYQTKVNDNGERVPIRNRGTVATVGFDRLLDRLGE